VLEDTRRDRRICESFSSGTHRATTNFSSPLMAAKALPRRATLARFAEREISQAIPSTSSTTSTRVNLRNPFLPSQNQQSGRWAPPKYSLRRQADLIKRAREAGIPVIANGTNEFLPPSPKFPKNFKPAPASSLESQAEVGGVLTAALQNLQLNWEGTPKPRNAKGLYGNRKRMFKGHKWEKGLGERREKRRIFARDLDRRR
jgi:large subunit ribosomal protein L25